MIVVHCHATAHSRAPTIVSNAAVPNQRVSRLCNYIYAISVVAFGSTVNDGYEVLLVADRIAIPVSQVSLDDEIVRPVFLRRMRIDYSRQASRKPNKGERTTNMPDKRECCNIYLHMPKCPNGATTARIHASATDVVLLLEPKVVNQFNVQTVACALFESF